jgi:hypothetical protein
MPEPACEPIDAARIAAVSAALGPQRLHELMLLLGGRVHRLAAAAELFPENAESCLAALHQSRGSAASLGLVALATALDRMEAEAAIGDVAAVRQAGRALPQLWEDALRRKQALLF